MVHKLLLRSLVLVAAVTFFITPEAAFAAATGAPDKYVVMLKKLELWNGADWIPIFDGTSPGLDIASVSGTNQFVGNFLSGLEAPDGTYTKVKVQVSPTVTIKGTLDGYATNGGTKIPSNEVVCTSTYGGTPVDCTMTSVRSDHVPEVIVYDINPSIVVKDGVADRKIRIYFDVTKALTCDNEYPDNLYPNIPDCSVVSIAK